MKEGREGDLRVGAMGGGSNDKPGFRTRPSLGGGACGERPAWAVALQALLGRWWGGPLAAFWAPVGGRRRLLKRA